MTLGEFIKNYRTEHQLSLKALGDRCGVTAAYLSLVERGLSASGKGKVRVGYKTLEKIAIGMGMTVDYMVSQTDDYGRPGGGTRPVASNIINLPETKPIPILGRIACGSPMLAEENLEGYAMVPDDLDADFCVIAKGDSMEGVHICDGDTVYIRAQPMVENGEIAAVQVGDEATLKRVYKKDNVLTLVAENPAYQPMIYVGKELLDIRILGKAIAVTSIIKHYHG